MQFAIKNGYQRHDSLIDKDEEMSQRRSKIFFTNSTYTLHLHISFRKDVVFLWLKWPLVSLVHLLHQKTVNEDLEDIRNSCVL